MKEGGRETEKKSKEEGARGKYQIISKDALLKRRKLFSNNMNVSASKRCGFKRFPKRGDGKITASHSSGSETVAAAVAAGVGSFISISGEPSDNRWLNPKKAAVTSCFQRAD